MSIHLRIRLLAVLVSTTVGCALSHAPEPTSPPSVPFPAHGGPWVVDFVDGTDLSTVRTALGEGTADWFHPLAADDAIVVVPHLTESLRAQLQQRGDLEAIEPSMHYSALGFPDDPLYPKQWNLHRVDAPSGWRLGGGTGVVVAVIDTGVSRVEDLQRTAILEGASFVQGEDTEADGNGHGTHVAGTIAQSTHNGVGVAGMAPGATILPIKALSASGGGQSEWIAAAIDEAGDRGAQIINLSLGGPPSEVIANAVRKARARGILIIAAAGNSGREGVSSPASLPGVVAVSATGPDDARAPYSTFGPEVLLSAPGGDKTREGGGILQDTISSSSASGHAYTELQGTSMATPHVAGAAAVLWGATGGGADHVQARLTAHAVDLGPPGRDPHFGHGRLDMGASVRAVVLRERGLAFLVAGLGTWLLAGLAGVPAGRFRVAVGAALTAGGVFFLPLLPVEPATWSTLAGRPLLLWADTLLGLGWSRSPVVLSAALPMVLTFLLGPSRRFGIWVAACSAGVGFHLVLSAFQGSLSPSWIPNALAPYWLGLHGVVSLAAAMAAFGVQRVHNPTGDRS